MTYKISVPFIDMQEPCPTDVRRAFLQFTNRLRELENDPDLSGAQRAQLANYITMLANKDSARAMQRAMNKALINLQLLFDTDDSHDFNYSAQLRSYTDEMNDYLMHFHERGQKCHNCAPQRRKDEFYSSFDCDVTQQCDIPYMGQ